MIDYSALLRHWKPEVNTMRFHIYTIFLIVAAISLSCKQADTVSKQISEFNKRDSFYHDYPRSRFPGDFELKKWENDIEHLGLENLSDGFDSVQIRLDYGGPMMGNRIVILKNQNSIWSAEVLEVTFEYNKGFEDSLNVDYWKQFHAEKKSEKKTPKSGWKNFLKKLFSYNILTLPHQYDINGFKESDAMDGGGASVEIATKNAYRIYLYSDPDKHLQFKEVVDLSNILRLVDNELGLLKMWNYTNEKLPKDEWLYPEKIIGRRMNLDYDSTIKPVLKDVQFQEISPEDNKKKNPKK